MAGPYAFFTRTSTTLGATMAAGATTATLATAAFGSPSLKVILTIDGDIPAKAADFEFTVSGTALTAGVLKNGPDVQHDSGAQVWAGLADEHMSGLTDGTAIADGAVLNRHVGSDAVKSSQMFYGLVRNRQGGTTGDASWGTVGSSNTATDAKDAFIQVGSVSSSAGGGLTVTFPTPFTQVPVVQMMRATTGGAANAATTVEVYSVGTTSFNYQAFNTSNSRVALELMWVAFGQ